MLPWPPGAGTEAAQEQRSSDQAEACSSSEEGGREPGNPAQDRLQPVPLGPSEPRRQQLLPCYPAGLTPEPSPGTPVPLSPQVPSSGMPLFSPWDPNYGAKVRPQQTPGCGSGVSFSGRTLCHPSFWPMYETWGRGHRYQAPILGHHNGQQAPRDAEFPVMCPEDVFFLDPLLPAGQRVPLYLSEVPQQAMKLQLPPPIMSPSVHPSQPRGYCTTQLSGRELIAITGLLQMSQGEPRPGSSAAPPGPADPMEPISDHQSSSGSTDPST
ncbi:PREDICTED: histone deacetylase complex subunit SAP25 isoform X2 [Chinchilla lanigera]|uniref:histone deacetylase complex subunit SAP25 isoform X2 n=1 Tax=Chinchilla lanigera TaxID=34839 RepID=UPI00038E9674|nr:PREDICTED: histone deacetylase complex subunit SAP25 isoform X2 [Chinchilla lanigera]